MAGPGRRGDVGNDLANGVGDAVCRRCGCGVEIDAWANQDGRGYSCRISGIRIDSVGEEDQGMHLWSGSSTASKALQIEAMRVLQRERGTRHQE